MGSLRMWSVWVWSISCFVLLPKICDGLTHLPLKNCWKNSSVHTESGTESPFSQHCTMETSLGESEAGQLNVNCLDSTTGTARIIGDYEVLYINCSSTIPLDFNFNGIIPNEAIDIRFYRRLKPDTDRDIQSFHVDIKVYSIKALFQRFNPTIHVRTGHTSLDKYIRPEQRYSRTGLYSFSGFHANKNYTARVYLFLEEPLARPSFVRNPDTWAFKLDHQGRSSFFIPCRPTHLDLQVTSTKLSYLGSNSSFDPAQGFLTDLSSWNKSNENLGRDVITCQLFHKDTIIDSITLGRNGSGPDPEFGFENLPLTRDVNLQVENNALENGTVFAYPRCTLALGPSGKNSLSVLLASNIAPNHAMNKLLQHFVLPKFVNNSFGVVMKREKEVFNEDIISPAGLVGYVGNVFCGDEYNYKITAFGNHAQRRTHTYFFSFDLDYSILPREVNPVDIYFRMTSDHTDRHVMYAGSNVTFTCAVNNFVFVPPMIWYTERDDGSVVKEYVDEDWTETRSKFRIELSSDMKRVSCASSFWYKVYWRNSSTSLNVTMSTKPVFKNSGEELMKEYPPGSHQALKCEASGEPAPKMYWEKDGKILRNQTTVTENVVILHFSDFQKGQDGDYECVAGNIGGEVRQVFSVRLLEDVGGSQTVIFSVIGFLTFGTIFGVILFFLWRQNRRLKKNLRDLTDEEVKDFIQGTSNCDLNDPTSSIIARPYNQDYEVPRENLRLEENKVLGSGQFGIVHFGHVIREDEEILVAIKTVKPTVDALNFMALLSEIKIMAYLEEHPNIACLVAACTANIKRREAFAAVEFCGKGDLQKFLQRNREGFQNLFSGGLTEIPLTSNPVVDPGNYEIKIMDPKEQQLEILSSLDLVKVSAGIANGMNYLTTKNVIHGDLAARNVLLTELMEVKISDFGLSRQLLNYSNYVKKPQQVALPWKWMSIEALKDMNFSVKSDVWSFGVVLYEIFSLAESPYPGFTWDHEFIDQLLEGYRMKSPEFGSPQIYQIMTECWAKEPKDRPCFTELSAKIHEVASKLSNNDSYTVL